MATTYFFITPPVKNQVWEFWCLLTSQADTDVFQTTVTLAAGDVTVFRDGASLGNIDTLPTEVGVTGVLRVQLSADEMNGDRFTLVKFHDAAGAEWQDKAFLVPLMQAVTVPDAADVADAVWDETLSAGAHANLFSAGKRLQNVVLRGGTAMGGGDNYIVFPGPWSAVDGMYEQNIVSIVDGLGVGQTRLIVEYVGADRRAYVDRDWAINPDATSEIELLPFSASIMSDHGLAQAGTANSVTLAATASAVDGMYVGSVVFISTGTGSRGQIRLITAYAGGTRIATVSDAWTVIPDATSVYKIFPIGRTIVDSMSATASAQVNAQVDTALADVDLDHLIQVTAGTEKPTDGSYLDQVMNKNASQTFDASTDSLEAVRDTLTPGSVNVVSFVSGDTLNFVVGVTFDQTLPQSGAYTISATWSKMYFTLKRDADIETDAQAVVKIQATNGGAASDGLIVLNGSSSGLTAANASLTVNQVAGTVRLIVTDDAAAQLTELDGLTWDFKEITAGGASNVVTRGQATVSYTPTRAIT
jgi:hypothetical protein